MIPNLLLVLLFCIEFPLNSQTSYKPTSPLPQIFFTTKFPTPI